MAEDPKLAANAALWKLVATTVIGIVVTMGTAWFSFGADKVSRADVEKIVDERVSRLASDLTSLRADVKELSRSNAELVTEVKVLTSRLNEYLAVTKGK